MGGGLSITGQIWHQSLSAYSSQVGKQGESHYIPPSAPSPESGGPRARKHARTHAPDRQDPWKRHGFLEPNAGLKLSPHVAPAATRSAASRRSHPEQQRGRPPSGGGLRGGKDRSVPSASAGCVRFDDDKIICMYLAQPSGVLHRAAEWCAGCAPRYP